MSDTVKAVIREEFLRNHGTKDVHTLAAERLAISMLDLGFKELKKISAQTERESKPVMNMGL